MKTVGLFISSINGGGAERVFSRLSKALSKYYKVYILVIDNRIIGYPVSVELINLGGDWSNYRLRAINALLIINNVIKDKGIDCVISALDIPSIITGGFVKRCKRINTIRATHGSNSERKGLIEYLKNKIRKCYFKKADAIVFISRLQMEIISEEFGISKDKSYVIENLYNIDEIMKLSYKIDEKIDEKINSSNNITICTGNLLPVKGHENLIRAFARVVKKEQDAILIILGEGPQRQKLSELIKELRLSDNVILYGRSDNPFSIIRLGKMSIGTSYTEGFPNALVEAMCLGKPVMFTDCMTGPGEILRKEFKTTLTDKVEYADYGVLLPNLLGLSGDRLEKALDDIADAWINMLSDENLRKSYGEKALERAKEYSYERCIGKYRDLIEALT